MGINAPLTEGHNSFGERPPRGFDPFSRDFSNPGKGRVHPPKGHYANSRPKTEPIEEQVKPVEESRHILAPVEESTDKGRSEVEIALWTAPPEYQFRIGDELF